MSETLRIISVDDHVLEPPDLWSSRLPERYREIGPRVVRDRAKMELRGGRLHLEPRGVAEGEWSDWWLYEDLQLPLNKLAASAGMQLSEIDATPQIYDNVRPGCWQQAARLDDMDINSVEAAVCFPNVVPRFCGQTFLEAKDKELASLCVQAYNDWMIAEWSAGAAYGRLIPLTLVQLWDVQLAAAEVRRCAAKGSHAIAFSENPYALGQPSVHRADRYWDPLFRAMCEETETVINIHIGSSSTQPSTAPEAPHAVSSAIFFQNTMGALCDHLLSGTFERFANLKIVLAEGQVGWMPYVLDRLDKMWSHRDRGAMIGVDLPNPPSSYMAGHVYGCVYDDEVGLRNRDLIGMDRILFEADYPHNDGTFPYSLDVVYRLCEKGGLSEHETWQLIRGNAIEALGLRRYGIDR